MQHPVADAVPEHHVPVLDSACAQASASVGVVDTFSQFLPSFVMCEHTVVLALRQRSS